MAEEKEEIWRPVPGYEGLYSVSNLGQVRRETTRGRWKAGRILKSRRIPGSGFQVCLCKDGKQTFYYVHRIVMRAFVGPCHEGMEVCHWDGNPANNHLENLRYDSHSENLLDCHRYGGKVNGSQILTPEQVAEIRKGFDAGESNASLACRFGVTVRHIWAIRVGRRWAHKLDQLLLKDYANVPA